MIVTSSHGGPGPFPAARPGLGGWPPGLNVSRLPAGRLDGASAWPAGPVFTALLADADAA